MAVHSASELFGRGLSKLDPAQSEVLPEPATYAWEMDKSWRAQKSRVAVVARLSVLSILAIGLLVAGCSDGSSEKVLAGDSPSAGDAKPPTGQADAKTGTAPLITFRPVLTSNRVDVTVTTVVGGTTGSEAVARG
ncbi:MAG TPA: hypothetical protein VL068_08750 [Microthrixaceae bacterium]|nr:hypothetical protein [Microthrixaceae bacterium]